MNALIMHAFSHKKAQAQQVHTLRCMHEHTLDKGTGGGHFIIREAKRGVAVYLYQVVFCHTIITRMIRTIII